MPDYKTFKKTSGSINRLIDEIEKINNPEKSNNNFNKDDDRFWTPTVDKAENGMATIRFLPTPAVDGDDGLPWVRIWRHAFQGPSGSWYIENSLTTIGQKDPVSDLNSKLWNSGVESDKEIARKQKRSLQYISNILVIDDPANPENNGKVKLFKYGKKIFEKIMSAMQPEFADETPIDPFDLEDGANFKLKIRKVDGFRNYDKSEFSSPSSVDGDLDKIWNSEYSLKEFVAPDKFKSYAELHDRLNKVLGLQEETVTAPPPKEKPSPKKKEEIITDDDEDLEYFSKLTEE